MAEYDSPSSYSYGDDTFETPIPEQQHQQSHHHEPPIHISRSSTYSHPASTPQRQSRQHTPGSMLQRGLYTPGTPKIGQYVKDSSSRPPLSSPRTPSYYPPAPSFEHNPAPPPPPPSQYPQQGQDVNPAFAQGAQQMVPNGGQQPQLFPPAQGGGFIGKLLTPVKKIAQHVFTPKSAAKSAGGGGNAGAGGVPGDDGDKDMGGSVEEKKNVEKKKPPPKARSHIPTEGLPWKDKNWKPKNDNDDQKPWKRKVK